MIHYILLLIINDDNAIIPVEDGKGGCVPNSATSHSIKVVFPMLIFLLP